MNRNKLAFILLAVFIFNTSSANLLAVQATPMPSEAPQPSQMQLIQEQFEKAKYSAFKVYSNAMEQFKEGKINSQALESIARLYEISLKLASTQLQSDAMDVALAKISQTSPAILTILPNTLDVFSTSFISETSQITSQAVSKIISPIFFKEFEVDPQTGERIKIFLKKNITDIGMPLSYFVPKGYWNRVENAMDDVDSVLERLLTNFSLSIYDAAVWQIALTVGEWPQRFNLVDQHTEIMSKGKIGDLHDIRATYPFMYGDKKIVLDRKNAYFFRIISDHYLQIDPKDGKNYLLGFPNSEILHHEDWKPITGEQAWAAIIGPIQVAYFKYQGNIPLDSVEMQLALDILPALEAMQSPIGAIYHAPEGTHGKNPKDISNENNFSVYAALKMLKQALNGRHLETEQRIDRLIAGQEKYFKEYAFNFAEEVFYQGGYYLNEQFIPTEIFAVDCQTWGTAVLGQEFIDKAFGEGMAYRIWQNTKRRSGYYDGKKILGIGFTDGHKVLSSEWTAGAILNLKLLAKSYEKVHPDWAVELDREAVSMRFGLETLRVDLPNGGIAYKYANTRTFIPFGWWANPIPCLVGSAWVLLIDRDFNPFLLGGGPAFLSPKY